MIVQDNFDPQAIGESIQTLWEPLTPSQRQYLVDHMRLHVYDKGESLYTEGEQPSSLMCLLSGKVKVSKSGVGGRPQIIRVVEPMELFSFRAAFVDECYHTTASAIETSTVCLIPMAVVHNLVESNAELAYYFIRQLAHKLGEADALTVSLTQKHMRGRLAEALLVLSSKYGYEDDGSTLGVYLSREELANMSNMTTSNAIRILSAFVAEGVLIVDGRKIKLLDEQRLQQISEQGM